MKKGKHGWDADFPLREEVEDYAGTARVFVITCYETPLGFTVRAEEEGSRDLATSSRPTARPAPTAPSAG